MNTSRKGRGKMKKKSLVSACLKKGSSAHAWMVVIGLLCSSVVLLTMATPAYAQPVLNPDNGHYYELIEVEDPSLTWYEARDAAAAGTFKGMVGHLATVTSAGEDNFLVNTFPGVIPLHVWIGGTDAASEGNWQWITGEAWSYTNWDPGEPNGGTDENCLEYTDGAAKWNDGPCDAEAEAYLVEYEAAAVPTMTVWGMLVLVIFSLTVGVYYLRRAKA